MRLLYLAVLALALPRPADAGPNADVEIDLTSPSAPCGLVAGGAIETSVAARRMSGVRQIKFEFSWEPAAAIDSVFSVMGAATAAEAFVDPFTPLVEGGRAEWGIATFGGDGLVDTGHLADFSFKLAPGVDPTTRVSIYLDAVSLGPSSAERDTVRPAPAMILGNYCDAEGQWLPPGIATDPSGQELHFSPLGSGALLDRSSGEAQVSARIFDSGRFRVGAGFIWDIDNLGPGPIYALFDSSAVRIEAGAMLQITSGSDHRGDTFIFLDAESGAEGQRTAAIVKVCDDTETLCAENQIAWESPITAVLAPHDAQPQTWSLEQNYPNPFNAGTTIAFAVPVGAPDAARLDIFNLGGQRVATPFAGSAPPGRHVLHWDGRTSSGTPAASGLYIYRLQTAAGQRHRSMLLLR